MYGVAVNNDDDPVDKPVEHVLALLRNASYSDIVHYVKLSNFEDVGKLIAKLLAGRKENRYAR